MANRKYTATLAYWKEYKCVGCGGRYRCKFEVTTSEVASSQQELNGYAERVSVEKLEKGVDPRPCPACGRLQPDMIAQQKGTTHGLVSVAFAVVVGAILFFAAMPRAAWLPFWLASPLVAVTALFFLWRHLSVRRRDLRRDRTADLVLARSLVTKGDIEPLPEPEAEDDATPLDDPPPARPRAGRGGLVAAGVGILLMLCPLAVRLANGVPTITGAKSDLAGVGGASKVSYPNQIEALYGQWTGQPQATVLDDGGTGLTTLRATTHELDANATTHISSKGRGKKGKDDAWVLVHFPADPSMVGKTLVVRVDLNASVYAASDFGLGGPGGGYSATAKWKLVPAWVAELYWWTLWAMIGGAVVFFVSGFTLRPSVRSLRDQPDPPTITRIDPPADV